MACECLECGKVIPADERMFAVASGRNNVAEPLCSDCKGRVPLSALRTGVGSCLEQDEYGVGIYDVVQATVEDGAYSGFFSGKHIGALVNEHAPRHLPNCSRKLTQPPIDVVARSARRTFAA